MEASSSSLPCCRVVHLRELEEAAAIETSTLNGVSVRVLGVYVYISSTVYAIHTHTQAHKHTHNHTFFGAKTQYTVLARASPLSVSNAIPVCDTGCPTTTRVREWRRSRCMGIP